MTQDYYAQVAAAFDRAAASYRGDYAANPIMAWLADDTFGRLCRLFPAGSRLLEIGCGTGEMALRLAEAGRIIVASDIAPAMIAQAQRNAAASPAASRLTWLTAAAGELSQAVAGLHVGENVIARSGVCSEAISADARDCFGPNGGPRNDGAGVLGENVIARSGVCGCEARSKAISADARDCFGPNGGPRNDGAGVLGENVIARSVFCGCEARSKAISTDARDCFGPNGGPRNDSAGVFGPCFDGAYSNFGPLNCEPELGRVARDLAEMLPPGAAFLCSVMNRWCAWEIGWGLLRLRPREATRRLGRGWVAAAMSAGPGEAPSRLPVRYFTPREFARAFRPSFCLETCLGYPTLLPPPYLAGRFTRAISRLGGLERRVAGWPGFRSLGDHFLLVLRRTGEVG